MNSFKPITIISIVYLLCMGCSSSGTGSKGGGKEKKTQYTLSVSTTPSEGGSVDPSNGTYEEGTSVTVEATAGEGWEFIEWSGDRSSSNNPLSFTINSNTDLTANFAEIPTSYSFTAAANPTDGGTVSPQDTTVEEGSQLTVEATASEGWTFTEWTGDINSTENPLSFNINSDTDLAANFEQIKSEYSFLLAVEDSEDSIELAFGQTEGATDGFNNGIDTEAPPPPPEGALNAFFEGQDRKLLDDFRAASTKNLTWTLQYQIGSGKNLTLSWTLDETALNGSVTLTDDNGSFQVDMLKETEFSFDPSKYNELLIKYELNN